MVSFSSAVAALAFGRSVSAVTPSSNFTTTFLSTLGTMGLARLNGFITAVESDQSTQDWLGQMESGNFTLLAPSDAAWAAVSEPADVVQLMKYHTISNTNINPSYVPIGNDCHITLTTALSTTNSTYPINLFVPTGASLSPSGATGVFSDLSTKPNATFIGGEANAAVTPLRIQEIDTVLDYPLTLTEAFNDTLLYNSTAKLDKFQSFLGGVGNLTSLLGNDTTGFTIFAPVDEGFTSEYETDISALSSDKLENLAKNHIFMGQALYVSILSGSAQLSTASGERLSWCYMCSNTTSGNGTSLLIPGTNITANVLRSDVLLKNGVLHIIDALLYNTAKTSNVNVAPSASTSSSPKATSTGSTPTATHVSSSPRRLQIIDDGWRRILVAMVLVGAAGFGVLI